MSRGNRQVTDAGILELKRQGMTRHQIIQAGFARSSVYRAWPVEGKGRDASQITVPLGSASDPLDPTETISVQLSHAEFAGLATNPSIVAGMMQSEREEADSLRTRVLALVCGEGPFTDVLTLMRSMRRPGDPRDNFGSHEITHILKSLNRQGLVTYVENNVGGNAIPIRITATDRGFERSGFATKYREVGRHKNGTPQHKTDRTDFRTHKPRAEGGDIIREPLPEHRVSFPAHAHGEDSSPPEERPEKLLGLAVRALPPEAGKYPVLAALLAERQRTKDDEGRALKLMEAAELLADIDPEQAGILLARAEQVVGRSFTAIEIEILRYVQEVTGE